MCAVKMACMIFFRGDLYYIHKSIELIMKMVFVVSTRAPFSAPFFCPTRLQWFDFHLKAFRKKLNILTRMFTTVQYVSYWCADVNMWGQAKWRKMVADKSKCVLLHLNWKSQYKCSNQTFLMCVRVLICSNGLDKVWLGRSNWVIHFLESILSTMSITVCVQTIRMGAVFVGQWTLHTL